MAAKLGVGGSFVWTLEHRGSSFCTHVDAVIEALEGWPPSTGCHVFTRAKSSRKASPTTRFYM